MGKQQKRSRPVAAVIDRQQWGNPPSITASMVPDGTAWVVGVPSLAQLREMQARAVPAEAGPDETWRPELFRREQAAPQYELEARSRMLWEIRRNLRFDDHELEWRRKIADLVDRRRSSTTGRRRQELEAELLGLGVVVIDELEAVYAATLDERRNGPVWAYARLARLADPPKPPVDPDADDARARALLLGRRIAALRGPGPSTIRDDRDQVTAWLKAMNDLASNHRLMVEAELFEMAAATERQLAEEYGAVLRNGKPVGGYPEELRAVLGDEVPE